MEDSPNVSSSHARYLPIYMGLAFVGTLALGLIIGFLTRPLIIPDRVEVVEVVPTAALSTGQVTAQTDSPAQAANSTTSEAEASSTETQSAANTDDAPPTPTIMDFLMADARHIQGVEDAPVTIIEFSDFK